MNSKNNKIKNATTIVFDDILFKSILERRAYEFLKNKGFDVKYEPKTYVLWEGFKPTVPFYKRTNSNNTDKRIFELQSVKIQDIKYTPDFYFNYKGIDVFIEMKGFENDTYYLKEKMFRKYLETTGNSIFFKIKTLKELNQSLLILEDYAKRACKNNS